MKWGSHLLLFSAGLCLGMALCALSLGQPAPLMWATGLFNLALWIVQAVARKALGDGR